MRAICRICGLPLRGAEQAVGTCITCVQEVRYKKVQVKEAGYRYGAKRPNSPRSH